MSHTEFKVAFSLVEQMDGYTLNDPSYIQWYAVMLNQRDAEKSYEPLKFHKCTEADYAAFNPVVPGDRATLESLKR